MRWFSSRLKLYPAWRRLLQSLLFWVAVCLSLTAHAAPETIWIGHVEGEAAVQAAQAVHHMVMKSRRTAVIVVAPWRELTMRQGEPLLLVAVGSAAASGLAAWRPQLPLIATLLTRSDLESLWTRGRGTVSGVWVDQPIERMMALTRVILPSRSTAAVLLGPRQSENLPEIRRAAQQLQVNLRVYSTDVGQIALRLREALDDADALLALPEPTLINGETISYVLASTYRRNVPLLAFSSAYVRAGAVSAVYSTPSQLGEQTGGVVVDFLMGKKPVAPSGPADFEIAVNRTVARSLGISIDAEADLKKKMQSLLSAARQGGP